MTKILVDTNICLDVILNRKPYATDATKLIERTESGEFLGIIAAHSFDTIFYVLRKRIGKAKTYKGIKELRRVFSIASVNQSVIDKAINTEWDDFEDAIHYEAARAAGCQAIVTRNKKDFKKTDLSVFSPQELLNYLDQQS